MSDVVLAVVSVVDSGTVVSGVVVSVVAEEVDGLEVLSTVLVVREDNASVVVPSTVVPDVVTDVEN